MSVYEILAKEPLKEKIEIRIKINKISKLLLIVLDLKRIKANISSVITLRLIAIIKGFFLCILLDMKFAKTICIKPDPPTIIVVRIPNKMAPPPAFISIEGMIVCTSIKLEARERKIPCQIKALKFIFDIFSVNTFSIFVRINFLKILIHLQQLIQLSLQQDRMIDAAVKHNLILLNLQLLISSELHKLVNQFYLQLVHH